MIKGLEASRGFPGFASKQLLVLPGADAKARMNATIDPADVAKAVDG